MSVVGSPRASSAHRTEQMVGALIPRATRRTRPPLPLPLTPLPPARLPADEDADGLLLDAARLDRSGRFSARPLLQALRWTAGQRLDLAVLDDALMITGSPTGRHPVGVRGEIPVPEAVRALLRLNTDPRVILVAAPQHGILIVHPHQVVARLLVEHSHRRTQARTDDGS